MDAIAVSHGTFGRWIRFGTWRNRAVAQAQILPDFSPDISRERLRELFKYFTDYGFVTMGVGHEPIPVGPWVIGLRDGISIWQKNNGSRGFWFKSEPVTLPSEWVENARSKGCIVLTAPPRHLPFAGSAPIEQLVRDDLVLATVMEVHPELIAPPQHTALPPSVYAVRKNPEKPPNGVLPDANILIDLEHFYEGRMPKSHPKRADVRDTALYLFGEERVYPYYAIMEITRNSSGRVANPSNKARLVEMWAALSACDTSELLELFDKEESPIDVLRNHPRAVLRSPAASDSDDTKFIRRTVFPAYAVMLRMLQLTPPGPTFGSPRDKLLRFEALVRWMLDNDIPSSGYCGAVAMQWFLLSHRPQRNVEHVRRLLKFSSKQDKRVHDAWGAAWDLTLLLMLGDPRQVPTANPTILTKEVALLRLWEQIRVIPGSMNGSVHQYIVDTQNIDPGIASKRSIIDEWMLRLSAASSRRSKIDQSGVLPPLHESKVVQIVRQLESEVANGVYVGP